MSRLLMMSIVPEPPAVQDKVKNITRLARLDLEAETVSQATDEQIFVGNDEQKGKSDG